MEDEKLLNLKNAYEEFNLKKFQDVGVVQRLFHHFTIYTGGSPGSWSCSGCIRRCKEKTERILKNNNLL